MADTSDVPDPFGTDMRYGVGLTLLEAEWLKGELEYLAPRGSYTRKMVDSIMPGLDWAIETAKRDVDRTQAKSASSTR